MVAFHRLTREEGREGREREREKRKRGKRWGERKGEERSSGHSYTSHPSTQYATCLHLV